MKTNDNVTIEKEIDPDMPQEDNESINPDTLTPEQKDQKHKDSVKNSEKLSVKDFLYKDVFLEGFIWE